MEKSSRARRASGRSDRSKPATSPNLILAALPARERTLLERRAKEVDLAFKEVIIAPNREIEAVYFPFSGVVSLVTPGPDEEVIEVATIGNEGFVGMPVFLGVRTVGASAFAQVVGRGLRLAAEDFLVVLEQVPRLTSLLHRYAQALFGQISQGVACNRLHTVVQRCARWLLMTHDRVERDSFVLTQEFLGQMLGVRRAGVSEAAGVLQKAGYIRYSRAVIEVRDRDGLERSACGCYQLVRDEYLRLLPSDGEVRTARRR